MHNQIEEHKYQLKRAKKIHLCILPLDAFNLPNIWQRKGLLMEVVRGVVRIARAIYGIWVCLGF